MKFIVKYAKERIEEINVSNFNEASEMAKEGKKKGEVIVSVRSRWRMIAKEIKMETCDICQERKLCAAIKTTLHYYYINICKDCAEDIVESLEEKWN